MAVCDFLAEAMAQKGTNLGTYEEALEVLPRWKMTLGKELSAEETFQELESADPDLWGATDLERVETTGPEASVKRREGEDEGRDAPSPQSGAPAPKTPAPPAPQGVKEPGQDAP